MVCYCVNICSSIAIVLSSFYLSEHSPLHQSHSLTSECLHFKMKQWKDRAAPWNINVFERSGLCTVFDLEDRHGVHTLEARGKQAPTCSFFFPFPSSLSLCPTNAHTAFSICTPLSTLSLCCPLKPQVTRGQGRYHSVRGTLEEEERLPFTQTFFHFLSLHFCHSRCFFATKSSVKG